MLRSDLNHYLYENSNFYLIDKEMNQPWIKSILFLNMVTRITLPLNLQTSSYEMLPRNRDFLAQIVFLINFFFYCLSYFVLYYYSQNPIEGSERHLVEIDLELPYGKSYVWTVTDLDYIKNLACDSLVIL